MLFSPIAMHIPDGFLSVLISIVLWIISIVIVAYALKRVGKDLGERQVPLMGVLAAGIFAGQMLNFTVIGGTSGHLMGAAIATILMGPWAAILLLVLGANIFNMAIVGVAVAYMAYRTVIRIAGKRKGVVLVAGFIAAWLSIEIAALSAAMQLAISGTSPANLAIPAMAGVHALIGIGEGLITVGALVFLLSARPDLVQLSETPQAKSKMVWLIGLFIALILVIASPLASTNPDGLEWVASQIGFLGSAQEPMYRIIPDYLFPGISNEALATIVAGILGIVIVFGVSLGVAYTRRNRQTTGG
jgi:cobalt/nickel transport system permease protein